MSLHEQLLEDEIDDLSKKLIAQNAQIHVLEDALYYALEQGAKFSAFRLEEGRLEFTDAGCGCCAGDVVRGADVPEYAYDMWAHVVRSRQR